MRRTGIVIVGVVVFSATAEAYILPALFLMRMLAEQRRSQKIQDLSIQLTSEYPGRSEPVDERLYLKLPQRLRRVQQNGEGQLYVEREGARAVGTEGKLRRIKGPLTDLTASLLATTGVDLDEISAKMVEGLKQAGIDTDTVSLGRLDDKPVYIIGARSWETDKPQLWLEKNTFLPVRYLTKSGSSGLVETRMSEWGSSVTGNWFPRVIENYENGKLIRRAEVTQIKINQKLPDTLFEVPQ